MTAQVGDRLLLDGEEHELGMCPELLLGHPRLIELAPQEVRGKSRDLVFNTGCWRRYVATWAVRDNRLYLEGVEGIYRLDEDGPLFAYWVSANLRIPQGDILTYVGFEPIYERDLRLKVEQGVVVDRYDDCNKGWAEFERRLRGKCPPPANDADETMPGENRNS